MKLGVKLIFLKWDMMRLMNHLRMMWIKPSKSLKGSELNWTLNGMLGKLQALFLLRRVMGKMEMGRMCSNLIKWKIRKNITKLLRSTNSFEKGYLLLNHKEVSTKSLQSKSSNEQWNFKSLQCLKSSFEDSLKSQKE